MLTLMLPSGYGKNDVIINDDLEFFRVGDALSKPIYQIYKIGKIDAICLLKRGFKLLASGSVADCEEVKSISKLLTK